jgi:hypothetical protein
VTYRVLRPFGARKVGEIVHDDAFHNIAYLLAGGMVEPITPESDATTKPAPGARTKSKKPKTKE